MKIKFTNFGRSSLIDERKGIPERFHRKPKILKVLELFLVLSAIALIFLAVVLIKHLIFSAANLAVALSYLVVAYLLAIEDWRYRNAAAISMLTSIVGVLVWSYFRGAPQLVYLGAPFILWYVVYINSASKQYYSWCRSVA